MIANAATKSPDLDQKTLATQVLLDRLGFGPGVIDGRAGQSLVAAIKGFQQAHDLTENGKLDADTTKALDAFSATPGTIEVALSDADVAGPFVGPIPDDAAKQAALPAMGYSDLMELLSERSPGL
jgi:peptidoglycan hydrolase-like protein with peptidoglycan-binding domain